MANKFFDTIKQLPVKKKKNNYKNYIEYIVHICILCTLYNIVYMQFNTTSAIHSSVIPLKKYNYMNVVHQVPM